MSSVLLVPYRMYGTNLVRIRGNVWYGIHIGYSRTPPLITEILLPDGGPFGTML
jgi:hypothetical protein